MPTPELIRSNMRVELEAARAIYAKAINEKREMTTAEEARVASHLDNYESLKADIATAAERETRNQSQVKAALDALRDEPTDSRVDGPLASLKLAPGMGVKGAAATAWSKSAGAAIQTVMGRADGQKALISGSIDVPALLGPVAALPARPRTLLDLIRVEGQPADGNGNQFSYLRQLNRPTGAAAVADGQTKPTGTSTMTGIQDRFRIYALLSEVFPLRYLTDYNGLIDLLKTQLGEGVLDALERDIISGPATGAPGGTTENIVGLLNTSGVQTQTYSATVAGVSPAFETSLKAVTKVLTIGGSEANAIVLHPTDWEAISLSRIAKNPQNAATDEAEKRLHGVPVVLNLGMPVGKALAGDFNELTLGVRAQGRIDVDTGGDKFSKNQFQLRYEGAYGLKIGRANAFVVANLTA